MQYLANRKPGVSSYVFITNKEGDAILHPSLPDDIFSARLSGFRAP